VAPEGIAILKARAGAYVAQKALPAALAVTRRMEAVAEAQQDARAAARSEGRRGESSSRPRPELAAGEDASANRHDGRPEPVRREVKSRGQHRTMRFLLLISALLEAPTGIALLAMPAFVVDLLLGVPLGTSVGPPVARLAGVALIALGTACWGGGRDPKSRAASGVALGMLLYNLGVVVLLSYCRISEDMKGVALVPAAVLHTAMALWCIKALRSAKSS
jgi:hypothetical protein